MSYNQYLYYSTSHYGIETETGITYTVENENYKPENLDKFGRRIRPASITVTHEAAQWGNNEIIDTWFRSRFKSTAEHYINFECKTEDIESLRDDLKEFFEDIRKTYRFSYLDYKSGEGMTPAEFMDAYDTENGGAHAGMGGWGEDLNDWQILILARHFMIPPYMLCDKFKIQGFYRMRDNVVYGLVRSLLMIESALENASKKPNYKFLNWEYHAG